MPQITMSPINNHILTPYFISSDQQSTYHKFINGFFLTKLSVNFVFSSSSSPVFFLMMWKLDHSFTLVLIHYYGQMCKKYIIMGPLRNGHEIWMSQSWKEYTKFKLNQKALVWRQFWPHKTLSINMKLFSWRFHFVVFFIYLCQTKSCNTCLERWLLSVQE